MVKHGRDTVKKKRIAKGVARMGRIKALKKAIGAKKAARVAATGAVKSMDYGAAVHGVSDVSLEAIRRVGLAGMAPSAGGRSRTAVLAIRGDPAWQAAVAPISQWVRMAWKAKHDGGSEVTLEHMKESWKAVDQGAERLLDDEGRRK